MRFAKLQDFKQGHKERNNLFFIRRVAKKLFKARFAKHQTAFNGLHTAFHRKAVAFDIAQTEIDFRRFRNHMVLHAHQRFPQSFQRESVQLWAHVISPWGPRDFPVGPT